MLPSTPPSPVGGVEATLVDRGDISSCLGPVFPEPVDNLAVVSELVTSLALTTNLGLKDEGKSDSALLRLAGTVHHGGSDITHYALRTHQLLIAAGLAPLDEGWNIADMSNIPGGGKGAPRRRPARVEGSGSQGSVGGKGKGRAPPAPLPGNRPAGRCAQTPSGLHPRTGPARSAASLPRLARRPVVGTTRPLPSAGTPLVPWTRGRVGETMAPLRTLSSIPIGGSCWARRHRPGLSLRGVKPAFRLTPGRPR